ncbi:MAG: response regulator transcription factor [Campylobacterales bacterium]|nr:response regulator transcription factor [Campylobacterales bacterium]
MKIFLLESDRALQERIEACLNRYRLRINVHKVHSEEALLDHVGVLSEYALFALNLSNPLDPSLMHFLRNNGGDAPILLILEPTFDPPKLKTLYYHSYNDIIFKPFFPEEIMFRIYKLCDIWNDDKFFFSQETYFDCKHLQFIHGEEEITLGKKEALLLKFLLVKSPCVVSFADIVYYIYRGESVSEDCIRSLVRQLRGKIPLNFIETVKGEGYRVVKRGE